MQVEALAHLTFGGRYEMTQPAAPKTNMAIVYQAWDTKINRNVAVKFLLPQHADNEIMLTHFRREAEIAHKLEHPHIVPVTDYSFTPQHGMSAYLVMPWLPGEPLSARIESGYYRSFTVQDLLREAVTLLEKIGSALDYVHGLGIVHRDIKPSNIVLFKGEPYLIDFGIAGRSGQPHPDTSGSPRYVAPETAQGMQIDGRTDQYAMALVIYELLSGGQSPYEVGETTNAWHAQHIHQKPRAIRDARSDLPAAVWPILQRALDKQREARYPDMASFTQALRDLSEHIKAVPTGTRPVSPPRPRTESMPTRRAPVKAVKPARSVSGWLGLWLMLLALLAILALGAFLLSVLAQ